MEAALMESEDGGCVDTASKAPVASIAPGFAALTTISCGGCEQTRRNSYGNVKRLPSEKAISSTGEF
jgi:hypothetical protein